MRVVHRDRAEGFNSVDLYREGRFHFMAKDEDLGRPNEPLPRRASGQARGYISHLPVQIPPYPRPSAMAAR